MGIPKKSVKQIILVNSSSSAFGLAVGCCALLDPSLQAFCLIPGLFSWTPCYPNGHGASPGYRMLEEAPTCQATFSFLSTLPTAVPELNRSLYDQPSISLSQVPREPGMSGRDMPRAEHRLKPQTVQCILPQLELGAGAEHPDQDVHHPTMALYKYKLGLQPEFKRSRKRHCGVWKFVRYQISLGRWTDKSGESHLFKPNLPKQSLLSHPGSSV